jgi:hypothetical protein
VNKEMAEIEVKERSREINSTCFCGGISKVNGDVIATT